jgi:hypothetical protein
MLIAISVFAVVVVAGLFFHRLHAEHAFSRDLAAAVQGTEPTVHLRNIPSPAWERVYIFAPYTQPSQISSALGFAWNGSAVETIQSSDGVNLLVFVQQQRVVLSVLHPRDHGDFDPDSVGYNYSRDDAEFSIVRRPQDNWLLLQPVPNSRKTPHAAATASTSRPR